MASTAKALVTAIPAMSPVLLWESDAGVVVCEAGEVDAGFGMLDVSTSVSLSALENNEKVGISYI